MFQDEEEIRKLIELLNYRGVFLFHACQFKDFQSYLSLGGIPSHDALERHQLCYTPLASDTNDKQHGVWDKVFVNLEDTGTIFASGCNGTPNPYGPILFKIRPEALNDAEEVVITLRSAGAEDFDGEEEALTSIDEVDRVFLNPINANGSDLAKVRFGNQLCKAFPNKSHQYIRSTEVHCIFPCGFLSLKHVELVVVDPYRIREQPLIFWVNEERLARNRNFLVPLSERSVYGRNGMNKAVYTELVNLISPTLSNHSPPPSIEVLSQSMSVSPALRRWAQEIVDRNLIWQFERFAEYLRKGTLLSITENNVATT